MELDGSAILRFETGLFGNSAGRSSDVERAHRQLRSGFTDGLRRNDANSFADFHQFAGRQIASVASDACTAAGFAGQHRTNLYALDTSGLDGSGQIFGDLTVDIDDHMTFVVLDLLKRHTANDAVAQAAR